MRRDALRRQGPNERAVVITIFKRRLIRNRPVCLECRQRRPLFRYRWIVRADDQHTLCFQCFRALRNRLRGFETEVIL